MKSRIRNKKSKQAYKEPPLPTGLFTDADFLTLEQKGPDCIVSFDTNTAKGSFCLPKPSWVGKAPTRYNALSLLESWHNSPTLFTIPTAVKKQTTLPFIPKPESGRIADGAALKDAIQKLLPLVGEFENLCGCLWIEGAGNKCRIATTDNRTLFETELRGSFFSPLRTALSKEAAVWFLQLSNGPVTIEKQGRFLHIYNGKDTLILTAEPVTIPSWNNYLWNGKTDASISIETKHLHDLIIVYPILSLKWDGNKLNHIKAEGTAAPVKAEVKMYDFLRASKFMEGEVQLNIKAKWVSLHDETGASAWVARVK